MNYNMQSAIIHYKNLNFWYLNVMNVCILLLIEYTVVPLLLKYKLIYFHTSSTSAEDTETT